MREYKPYYTGNANIEDCYKRARYLAGETHFSGILLHNKDALRNVFMCKKYYEQYIELQKAIELITLLRSSVASSIYMRMLANPLDAVDKAEEAINAFFKEREKQGG